MSTPESLRHGQALDQQPSRSLREATANLERFYRQYGQLDERGELSAACRAWLRTEQARLEREVTAFHDCSDRRMKLAVPGRRTLR